MLYADLLCKLHLCIVELVHVAVDMVEIKILDVILLEIIDSVRFAIGLRYFCDYQMTQSLLGNPVDTDAVIDLFGQKLNVFDQQHAVDVSNTTFCLLYFLSFAVIEFKFLLSVMGA